MAGLLLGERKKRPPPKNLWVSLRLNHRFALFSQCFRGSVGLSFRGSDFHRACGTKNRMKKTTSRGVDEPLPPSLSHRPSPRVSRGRCDGEGGRGGPLLSSPSGGLPDQTCAAITSISPTDSPEEPLFLATLSFVNCQRPIAKQRVNKGHPGAVGTQRRNGLS